jgi:hypothetical protein
VMAREIVTARPRAGVTMMRSVIFGLRSFVSRFRSRALNFTTI